MAQPIKHDLESTALTVGAETAKWSLGGAIAAGVIGAAVVAGAMILTGGLVGLIVPGAATFSTGAAFMATGSGMIATVIGAAVGAVGGISTGGVAGAIGGGLFGIFKGGQRVSNENQAYREYVREHTQGHQNKTAKMFNDGEVKGIQEGYKIGRADGEKVGFQKGQEFVVNEIQNHMAAHPELMQQNVAGEGKGLGNGSVLPGESKGAGKIETGSKAAALSASCKCESRVDMVSAKRVEEAAAAKQL